MEEASEWFQDVRRLHKKYQSELAQTQVHE